MDLNLFDFSGRSSVGGQRRNAKDRPPKKDMHFGRSQERPLSSTPMRPAGPIRRTCGVIKLPVMYYPLRPPPSVAQLVTTADPQVVLGSVVQQLWVRRLSTLQPVDSVSGDAINPDSPSTSPENNSVPSSGIAVTSEQPGLVVQSAALSQASNTAKLPAGINSMKSPTINAPYNSVQSTNVRMSTTQQPPSLPNHYSASNAHVDNNGIAACVKSHGNPTAAQPTSNNNAMHPSPQPVAPGAVATATTPQSFIPIQQNGQGLLLQPNNVVYMQLPQGAGKGGNSNFNTKALQMVQQLPQGVPQQALNHSFITETDIRLQEQKVKLLRQQLGLTS